MERNTIFWDKKEVLGSGSYGEVFIGKSKCTNKEFAIKKLKNSGNNANGVDHLLLREIVIMKDLSHKNILEYNLFKLDY